MLSVKQEIQSSTAFRGVRFSLFGFDPTEEDEIRSKLVGGGGTYVSLYGPKCTHVIVDNILYDDPLCVAARHDGKILVTRVWVRHSIDVGMPVDTSPVMYRPVKDLNGILAAKDFVMCLTGYQRQDREDIMTMVSLMGAKFSKPLVANRVTHLICYKFEGEKYELAKRIKKIKLVNHRWLEECLKAWEILPEEDYSKSGYELEMMEAEAAKDSEDEAEDNVKHIPQRNVSTSPLVLQNKVLGTHGSPMLGRRASGTNKTEGLSTSDHPNNVVIGTEEYRPEHASNSTHITQVDHHPSILQDNEGKRGAESWGLDPQNAVSPPKKDLLSSFSASKTSANSNGSKYGSLCYSRKSPPKSGVHPAEVGSVNKGKHSDSVTAHITPSKEQNMAESSIGSKTPIALASLHTQGSNGLMCYKRKTDDHSDISRSSSKSQKLDSSPTKIMNDTDIQTPIKASKGTDKSASIGNLSNHLNKFSIPKPVLETSTEKSCSEKKLQESNCDISTNLTRNSIPKPMLEASTEKSCSGKKLQESNCEVSTNLTSVTLDGSISNNRQAQASAGKLGTSNRGTTPDTSLMSHAEKETQQNQQQSVNTASAENNVSKVLNSGSSNLGLAFAAEKTSSKSPKKKSIVQKTLGSRSRLKKGSSANKKGPVCTSGSSPAVDTLVNEGNEIPADPVKASDVEEVEMYAVVDKSLNQQDGNMLQFEKNTSNVDKPLDDETEAPPELEMVENDNEKSREDALSHGKTAEEAQGIVDTVDQMASAKTASKNINEQGSSACAAEITNMKLNKRKKSVGAKIRKKPDPKSLEALKPKQVGNTEKDKSKQSNEKSKRVLSSSGNSRDDVSSKNKAYPSVEMEKENQPVHTDGNMANSSENIGKAVAKSAKTIKNTKLKKTDNLVQNSDAPVWFILSGHKLQRKEFQKIIRRLRGKLCRDSHHWAYQATHFIVPDPVRRTEKFFAAAASGSWILKTDYLSASDQAGKLLAEEPYEWHKSGLSEDGAINLEAPRKWRLLRERTGHGALYGMRIVIYGECIAPPLDTLKRAVKAGDGTILATSPPYTRFLNSGVDFAIVSHGMPRVDMWVQEFLKHNIPCVLADYIVEYVCKPGFPLEKHVQYNTQEWAAKSFANLVRLSEEVVVQENEASEDDGVSCQVCGSPGRGDVMLICGTDDGSAGCGVGTHIDCCDPPLEEIPEENWFCPVCAQKRADNNASEKKKKKSSKSRKR